MNERQSSLTKQVKKGLSNIVKSRSSSSKASSSTSAEVNAKKLKLALANNASKKKKNEDITDSLPSSQEEKFSDPDPLEQSEYESAEEWVSF